MMTYKEYKKEWACGHIDWITKETGEDKVYEPLMSRFEYYRYLIMRKLNKA